MKVPANRTAIGFRRQRIYGAWWALPITIAIVGCSQQDSQTRSQGQVAGQTPESREQTANPSDGFQPATFLPLPGPQVAPLGQVELTKNGDAFFLRLQMGSKWENAGEVRPIPAPDLEGAVGQPPALINARGLSNGFVALVFVTPNSTIRGHRISTGIVLVSPALGPGGTAELMKQ